MNPPAIALRDLLGAPGVVGVVALALAGQEDADRVVEVIGPDGIEAVPALALLAGSSRTSLRSSSAMSTNCRGAAARSHAIGEVGEEVRRAVVDDGVGGVEPKAVDVVLAHPVSRVLRRRTRGPTGCSVRRS